MSHDQSFTFKPGRVDSGDTAHRFEHTYTELQKKAIRALGIGSIMDYRPASDVFPLVHHHSAAVEIKEGQP